MNRTLDTDLERQLGFRYGQLFQYRIDVEPIRSLLDAIDPVINQYCQEFHDKTNTGICRAISEATSAILDRLGPQLWPPESVDSSSWLVDAKVNNWNGLYPKNLCYGVNTDRDWIRERFTRYILNKCYRRGMNIKRRGHERRRDRSRRTSNGRFLPRKRRKLSEYSTSDDSGGIDNDNARTSSLTSFETLDDDAEDPISEPGAPAVLPKFPNLRPIQQEAQTVGCVIKSEYAPENRQSSGQPALFKDNDSQAANRTALFNALVVEQHDYVTHHATAYLRKPAQQAQTQVLSTPTVTKNAFTPPSSRADAVSARSELVHAWCHSVPPAPNGAVSDTMSIKRDIDQSQHGGSASNVTVMTSATNGPQSAQASTLDHVNMCIDWKCELDVTDVAAMEECATIEDFFKLVEAQMPDELASQDRRIMQLKVKIIDPGAGPNLRCRLLREERLSRGRLRQMFKMLKLRTDEVNLNVEVEWEGICADT